MKQIEKAALNIEDSCVHVGIKTKTFIVFSL